MSTLFPGTSSTVEEVVWPFTDTEQKKCYKWTHLLSPLVKASSRWATAKQGSHLLICFRCYSILNFRVDGNERSLCLMTHSKSVELDVAVGSKWLLKGPNGLGRLSNVLALQMWAPKSQIWSLKALLENWVWCCTPSTGMVKWWPSSLIYLVNSGPVRDSCLIKVYNPWGKPPKMTSFHMCMDICAMCCARANKGKLKVSQGLALKVQSCISPRS